MANPSVSIQCESCSTNYNFAIPNSVIRNPQKTMPFRCSVCGYRFNVDPKELLIQPTVASEYVLVDQGGNWQVHQDVAQVQEGLDQDVISADAYVKVFGEDWEVAKDSSHFTVTTEESELLSAEEVIDEAEDVEDEEAAEQDPYDDLSSEQQDWSALDPFSEEQKPEIKIPKLVAPSAEIDSGDDASDESAEEHEFVDESVGDDELLGFLGAESIEEEALIEEEGKEENSGEDRFVAEEIEETFNPDDFRQDSEEDEQEEYQEDFQDDYQDYEEEYQEEAVVEEEGRDEFIFQADEASDEISDEPEVFNVVSADEEVDEESSEPPLANEVWAQFDDEESDSPAETYVEEYEEYEAPRRARPTFEAPEPESAFQDQEFSALDTDTEIDSGDRVSLQSGQADDEIENIGEVSFEGFGVDEDSDDDENKPIERLSFFDPDQQNEEKSRFEVNPVYVLFGIIFIAIGTLAYAVKQKEGETTANKGLKTNSDRLVEAEEAKKGLQENLRNDGNGLEKGEGSEKDGTVEEQLAQKEEDMGTFQNPAILPDSEGEDLSLEKGETVDDITRRAWEAYNSGDADLSVRLFKIVLEKEPANFFAVSGLGAAYEMRGQNELAVSQYCQVATLPEVNTQDLEFWLGHAEQLGSYCN